MLDGKAVTPLYVQLMTEIEAKIMKGVYQPGERLQSESEMAKTFGVSIITVRNAVSALVDNEPVAIENNYFPLKYAFLLGETFDSNSLFEFMKDKAGVMVAVSEKWIELCKATTREAELLQLNKGTSLLYIKSVAYTQEKEPIYVGTQIFNGDRCSFYVCESTGI